MIQAIVYTSKTGYTQRYAQLLAERTGVPAYSAKEARGKLRPKAEIFYMGWLLAGTGQGIQSALGRYTIRGAAIRGSPPPGHGAPRRRARSTARGPPRRPGPPPPPPGPAARRCGSAGGSAPGWSPDTWPRSPRRRRAPGSRPT